MELKTNEKFDLGRKSGLFFSIGLSISLLLVIMAFEWRSSDFSNGAMARNMNFFPEDVKIPVTEIRPPSPPARIQPRLTPVPDDVKLPEVKVDHDAEMNALDKLQPLGELHVELPKEETEETFIFLEESASPKGGWASFYQYVSEKLSGHYPSQAQRMGIQGRVFVEFVVEKDGAVTDAKVMKGIGAGCDEVALRVVQDAPKWNPGKQRGKPARQRFTLSIVFKLG